MTWAMFRRATAVLVVVAMASGCAGADRASEGDDEREIVGQPPSESDDPFEVMKTPKEAQRAGRTGYIGDEESEDESSSSESSAESNTEEGAGPRAAEASEAEPTSEQRPDQPPPPSEFRCFSCVRICPVAANGEGTTCGNTDRDVVCGWGVHEDRERAEELARAECDGAVDLAGQMDQWSRIEGSCPPASCQSPK